ncbi:MAG TPA: hypothetical protein VF559_06365 [Caulobacteraceae bacterium]|jgi:hypothetical protein
MILFLLALLGGAAASSEALAAEVGYPAAPAAPQPKPKSSRGGDKVICKRAMNKTGSHIPPQPVCMMKRDWERQERIDSQTARSVQHKSGLGNMVPLEDRPGG